ncbi:MAG: hypothetical protein EKK40_06490 [Bradyrhizobiaceae bacterium]|nr:MAG: hypothetical protein EKK40_06490 [Bradyrhizobiaceae bacterium]
MQQHFFIRDWTKHVRAKFIWAMLGLAASMGMPSYSHADECLSAPKATTPAGQHWYYRIDRSTKKHCWYLADQGAKTGKTAAKPAPPAAAAQDTALSSATLDESVADAHAELPPSGAVSAVQAPVRSPAPAERSSTSSSNNDAHQLTTSDLIAQTPITLASRWPSPNEFQPTTSQPDQTIKVAAASPGEQPAKIDTSRSPGIQIGPAQIILCVLAVALALAAIFGHTLFRHAARRKRTAQTRRRQIWPDENPKGRTQPSYAQMITPERRARAMRVDQDVSEIERLLRSEARRLR